MTVEELREALDEGCAARTIYRDLEILQEVGFPLVNEEGRWRCLESGEGAWSVPVEPSQLLALSLMMDLVGPLQGTGLAEPVEELVTALRATLTPEGRAFLEEVRHSAVGTLFGPVGYADKRDVLDAVRDAVNREQRLRIVYAAPHRPPTERIVEPYTTWYAAGRLYLVAWCRRAEDVRTFAVQRIAEAEVTEESFDPDPTFDAADYARRSFGVFHGAVYHFVIDFSAAVAHLVRERRFHHTQRLVDRDDGSVRLIMDAAGLPEVAAWVTGFGGSALPIAPRELVDAVRRLHEEGLARLNEGLDG